MFVGPVSLVGSDSTRSKEKSSTLPVGSRATWTPKSGEGKNSVNRPNSAAAKPALVARWDSWSLARLAVRFDCGYPWGPLAASRSRACARAWSSPITAASSGFGLGSGFGAGAGAAAVTVRAAAITQADTRADRWTRDRGHLIALILGEIG